MSRACRTRSGSDGKRLYCYHDQGGYNGLCYTHRQAPFSHVSLRDEDWEVDLGEEKAPDQKGFVIASRKLTDGEDWHAFRPGSLMVFDRGDVVYGARLSHRQWCRILRRARSLNHVSVGVGGDVRIPTREPTETSSTGKPVVQQPFHTPGESLGCRPRDEDTNGRFAIRPTGPGAATRRMRG